MADRSGEPPGLTSGDPLRRDAPEAAPESREPREPGGLWATPPARPAGPSGTRPAGVGQGAGPTAPGPADPVPPGAGYAPGSPVPPGAGYAPGSPVPPGARSGSGGPVSPGAGYGPDGPVPPGAGYGPGSPVPPGAQPGPAGPVPPGTGYAPGSPIPPGAGGAHAPWLQPAAPAGTLALAGWWRRAGAAVIDGLIIGLLALALLFPFGIGLASVDSDAGLVALGVAFLMTMLVIAAVGLLYAPLMLWQTNGKTVGRMATGIRLVRANGERMTFGAAALREVVIKALLFGIAGSLSFGLANLVDYLWPLWDEERRALHDVPVNTRTILG